MIAEVSNPPEYANTTFLIVFFAKAMFFSLKYLKFV
jgi:hypothetical protein